MMREETGRAGRSILGSEPRVTSRIFFVCLFVDQELVYMTLGLLVTDRVHLSQKGKSIFTEELPGLLERALN